MQDSAADYDLTYYATPKRQLSLLNDRKPDRRQV
jgi:hypothetical protein